MSRSRSGYKVEGIDSLVHTMLLSINLCVSEQTAVAPEKRFANKEKKLIKICWPIIMSV